MDFPSTSNSIRSPYPVPFSVASASPSPSGSTIAILFLTNSIIVLENGGITPVLRYNVVMNPLKSVTLSLVSDSDPIGNFFVCNGYTEVKVVKNSFLRSNATMMKSLRTDCHESIRNVLASSGYTEVSKSTLKRICRKLGIARWPYKKSNKIGASIQSSLTEPFQDALPFNPHVQAAVQPSQPDAPFNPPPWQLSTITVAQTTPPERRMQDANFVTIKAMYYGTDTIVKFDLPSSATKDDLEGKVAKKLNLKVGSFTIKYQEQESEWITVTDSEDLQYCIREHGSLATITSITMLVQSTSSGSGPT